MRCYVLAALAALCLSAVSMAAPLPPVHAVGYTISGGDLGPLSPLPASATPADLSGGAEPGKVWTVVEVPWTEHSGSFDSDLAPLIDLVRSLQDADQPVVLAMQANRGLVAAQDDAGRRAWIDWLRAVTRRFKGQVRWYLLSDLQPPPDAVDAPKREAYDIKAAAVTIRAEDPAAGVALSLDDRAALERLALVYQSAGDLEPYVDGVCLHLAANDDPESSVAAAREILLPIDPGASLWLRSDLVDGTNDKAREDEVLRRAASILGARVDMALFDLPASSGTSPRRPPLAGRALRVMTRTLHTGLSYSTRENAGIAPAPGAPATVRWSRYFDDRNYQEAIVYWSDDPALDASARVAFDFDTVLRRNYKVLDPVSGNPGTVSSSKLAGQQARIDLPLAARPRLLIFSLDKSSPGLGDQAQEGQIEAERKITADEVIAVHQRFRAFQDDRLINLHGDSEMRLRVGLGAESGSLEVSLRGEYFWDRVTGAEWTIREKFVEGVRLTWDRIPEIPYIGFERAAQPPLDLRLDKRYRYQLDNDATIGDYKCWVLRFEPTDTALSLQKGRAFIDQNSGALVRVTAVQNNLEAPVVSNEETQEFRPVPGPDGTPFWVLDRAEGQQLYTIAGANLVVLRVTTFETPQLNDPAFEARRKTAYDSNQQMLRDTQRGMKWLTKNKEGERVESEGDPTHSFLIAGLLKDGDSGLLPAAGINYTNIDFMGKKKVLNVFFAGILANASLSDPAFLGTRLDAGVFAYLSGVPATDRDYAMTDEIEADRVRRFTQGASVSLGYPYLQFFKLKGGLSFDYYRYSQEEETENFQVPSDHLASTVRVGTSFDRGGWGAEFTGKLTRRSTWDAWGPDSARVTGNALALAKSYSTYRVEGGKSFFLPFFQKININAAYEAGHDLDRFSAFSFGLLNGSRMRGFGGSGIRYDRGLLAGASYGFNVNNVIKFDVAFDYAKVHDPRIAPDATDHLGVGLAANFLGPWKTFVRIDAGYALKSDLKQAEGGTEFFIVFGKVLN